MRRRTKIMVVAVVAVILALVAGLTSTVFANGSEDGADTTDNSSASTFASKVATVLGLDESQVADALKQARQEMQGEVVGNLLDKAVEKGLITQDEADQIEAWWQSRPDALANLGLGKPGLGIGLGWGVVANGLGETFTGKVATILGLDVSQVTAAFQQAGQEMRSEAIQNFLDKAVADGKITQDEANQIETWWQGRPEALAKLGVGMRARLCLRWGVAGGDLAETFTSKVATALGLDESQVTDAFKQARQEMQSEAVQNFLDKAVENGKITQDEANQIETWWQSRPDALSKLGAGNGLLPRNGGCQRQGGGGGGMGRGFGMMGPGF